MRLKERADAADVARAANELGLAMPAHLIPLRVHGEWRLWGYGNAAELRAAVRILARIAGEPDPVFAAREEDPRPLAERLADFNDPTGRTGAPIYMSIQLVTEVMDYAAAVARLTFDKRKGAPAELTASEWRALVILAEDASDKHRTTWSSVQSDKIMRRVGLGVEAWANLRTSLVKKGLLEIAEPGVKGRVAKYRFPDYRKMLHQSDEAFGPTPPRIDEESADLPHGSDEESGPMPHGSGEANGKCFMGSMTPTPQEPPQDNSSLSGEARILRAARVVAESEERDLIDWITKTHHPRGIGWWRAVVRNGDLPGIVGQWRAVPTRLPPRRPLAECAECRDPISGPVASDGLCRDCRTGVNA